jgi:hypothetical protein
VFELKRPLRHDELGLADVLQQVRHAEQVAQRSLDFFPGRGELFVGDFFLALDGEERGELVAYLGRLEAVVAQAVAKRERTLGIKQLLRPGDALLKAPCSSCL